MNQIIIFVSSLILSALINWILIRFSINVGVRNITKEDEIRWQKRKPSVGGLSFYMVFLIMYAVLSNLFFAYKGENFTYDTKTDLSLIVVSTLGFLIGLIDDARNTNPILKLLGQVSCGLVLTLFGVLIPISPNIYWNGFFTIFWVVFLMNSINMLDNMDGLTSIISFFILSGILSAGCIKHSSLSSYMIFVCGGAIFGFLIYNWNPSRIYMGDSGSQFLGVVLAHFSIVYLWQNRIDNGGYFQVNQFFLPLLVFTVPIFDTTTVFVHRLLRRQSPFVGGKDHLSHHFVYWGLKDSHSVMLLGLINLFFAFLGLYTSIQYPHKMLVVLSVWTISFIVLQSIYVMAKKFAPTEENAR